MKYNFSDCKFDINKFGGRRKIQDVYPELLPYRDLLEISEIDWKIGICLSDIGSPILKIKDINQRAREIFDVLGLDKNKDKNRFDDIINYNQGDIIRICLFMLEYLNNNKFSQWWKYQQRFQSMMDRLNRPLREGEDEDKYDQAQSKLQVNIDQLATSIEKFEIDLFGTAAMKAAVFREKLSLIRNYAEKHAKENQVE